MRKVARGAVEETRETDLTTLSMTNNNAPTPDIKSNNSRSKMDISARRRIAFQFIHTSQNILTARLRGCDNSISKGDPGDI
jgi:hypothetical protein